MIDLFIENGSVGFLQLDGRLILKEKMRLDLEDLIEIRKQFNKEKQHGKENRE